ncbi:hypothetical protein HHJ39_00045 [Escherichia coli]|nr:hypothetical protein HHJ39_00045 [Escherichia coli]
MPIAGMNITSSLYEMVFSSLCRDTWRECHRDDFIGRPADQSLAQPFSLINFFTE